MKLGRLLVIVGMGIFVAGCTQLSPPPAEGPVQEYPEQELRETVIKFYSKDKLQTVLEAGRVRKYQQRHLVIMDSGIVASFYDETGRQTTTLWADSGNANELTKDLVAMGNVIAVSDSGQRLETSLLRWDDRTKRVATEAAVKISTPTDTLYGIGFRADQNLKNWSMDRPQGVTFRDRPAAAKDSIKSDSARTLSP